MIFILVKLSSLDFFKNKNIEIIKSSVRIDVVGMPKFTLQELKKKSLDDFDLNPKTVTSQNLKRDQKNGLTNIESDSTLPPALNEKNQTKVQKKASGSLKNLLTSYSSKKIMKKNRQAKKNKLLKENKKIQENLGKLALEGNKLFKGASLSGDYSDEDISEFSKYIQTLPEYIREHWKLPSYLIDRDLKCRIKIFLSRDGDLLKSEVIETSGVEEFDQRATEALKRTSFPLPSKKVASRLITSGIILGFPI